MSANFLTLLLQSLAALAAVLGLFAGLVWLLKRVQQRMPGGAADANLRVTGRCALDARHGVVELAAGGRRWLVGISPQGLTALGHYPAPDDATPATDVAANARDCPPMVDAGAKTES